MTRVITLSPAISSIKDGWHDDTCVFKGREHAFTKKPSFVFYGATVRMSARHIKNMLAKKYFKEQPSASDEMVQLICEGVCESDHTPRGCKRYYERNGD